MYLYFYLTNILTVCGLINRVNVNSDVVIDVNVVNNNG